MHEASPAWLPSGHDAKHFINMDKIELIGTQVNYFNRFKEVQYHQLQPHAELRERLMSLPEAPAPEARDVRQLRSFVQSSKSILQSSYRAQIQLESVLALCMQKSLPECNIK